MSTLFIRVAAALCFLAVALGAFGAHSLRSTLETHRMLDVWNKAVLYHFIHAIALFVLALYGAANRGAMISHAQPARKQRPPSGVTGPSQRRFVSAIRYKLPLKRKMPAKISHHAPRLAAPKSASTNNAIA